MKTKGIGKISAIKREYSNQQRTMTSELMNKGYTRIPGTGVYKFPYKEITGKYRTGLDPDAAYIHRISDESAKEIEIERVTKLKKELEAELSLDLGPTSSFWNYKLSQSPDDMTHVQPAKLMDGDNLFDLSVSWQKLTYAWLRVHPTIATSLQAWQRGECLADTQFYVNDESVEADVTYKKKQAINKAIAILESLSPTTRRKVARVMGLPVSEDTMEEVVYNLIDAELKKSEFTSGKFQGLSPVKIFTNFATMSDKLLTIKDLVKQAVTHSIYRVRSSGKFYEGEAEIAANEDDLIKFLADDDNQEFYLELERKVKSKKAAFV